MTGEVRARLRDVRGFVFDMDGTLVLGDRRNRGLLPLPGAVEVTRWLGDRGVPVAVITNGTTRPPRRYADVLQRLGLEVADDAVVTPATSAVRVLQGRGHERAVVLGGTGLTQPLEEAGIHVLDPHGTPVADAVVVGWYPELTWPALEAACAAVWGGARLYSCSQSLFFATADGKQLGTSRAMAAMITDLTGTSVEVVGKPAEHVLRDAAQRLGVAVSDLVVVGDDPELEVPMARSAGALAIAVDTGVGTPDSYADAEEDVRPHLHLGSVADLLALLQEEIG